MCLNRIIVLSSVLFLVYFAGTYSYEVLHNSGSVHLSAVSFSSGLLLCRPPHRYKMMEVWSGHILLSMDAECVGSVFFWYVFCEGRVVWQFFIPTIATHCQYSFQWYCTGGCAHTFGKLVGVLSCTHSTTSAVSDYKKIVPTFHY